jgi:hypothetical protein
MSVLRARREMHEYEHGRSAPARRAHEFACEHGAARGEPNVLLDAVAELIAGALKEWGFALRAPVAASFEHAGGVKIVVRLRDRDRVGEALAALAGRFPDPHAELVVR